MWALVRFWCALSVFLAVVQSVPGRNRRQEDGDFWWANLNKTSSPSLTVDGRQSATTIDPAIVEAILANGPENAGKTSPHPGKCICVPYYLCLEGQIITDGAGIIDIRKGNSTRNPAGILSTHVVSRRQAPPPDAVDSGLVGGNCPGSVEVCCTSPQTEKVPDVLPPPSPSVYQPICGIRNPDGINVRIANFKENEAQYGEFPWMVAVLKPTISTTTGKEIEAYQCGGSLIHAQVVLTAAHCIAGKDPKSLKIRVGEWDTQSAYEFFPHQDRRVVDAIIHANYKGGSLFNDVALLFLESPLSLGPEAETICLPPADQIFDGARCFATGWGKDQFGQAGKYQHILKKVELPVVPFETCQASLKKTRLGANFRLHESFLCAGGEAGKDTCKGDGGSPLVCPVPGTSNPKRYVQVGIVAWGIGCGENGVPGVYANIPKLTPWIEAQVTGKMNLQPDFFRKQLV